MRPASLCIRKAVVQTDSLLRDAAAKTMRTVGWNAGKARIRLYAGFFAKPALEARGTYFFSVQECHYMKPG